MSLCTPPRRGACRRSASIAAYDDAQVLVAAQAASFYATIRTILEGAVMRTCLFVGVALYAWGTVLVLERWRPALLPAVRPKPASEEAPA